MASCLLIHGPSARAAALVEASKIGRLVHPPFGDEGLTVDESREITELLLSTPVGSMTGVVVVGPIDEQASVRGEAGDALLKTLEEFRDGLVRPILWAHDIGGVSKTIQSRCLVQWAGPTPGVTEDDLLTEVAERAVSASVKGDRLLIAKAIKSLPKGQERAFLGALADILSTEPGNQAFQALWERVRRVTRWKNPTPIELTAMLLPES